MAENKERTPAVQGKAFKARWGVRVRQLFITSADHHQCCNLGWLETAVICIISCSKMFKVRKRLKGKTENMKSLRWNDSSSIRFLIIMRRALVWWRTGTTNTAIWLSCSDGADSRISNCCSWSLRGLECSQVQGVSRRPGCDDRGGFSAAPV